MSLLNISFGRAISVNSSKQVAEYLSREINKKDDKTPLGRYLNRVFYDADKSEGRARVFVFEDDRVYIFTRRESREADKLVKDANIQIAKNQRYVNKSKEKPLVDFYQKVINGFVSKLNSSMNELIENGENGKRKASLDVECCDINGQIAVSKINYQNVEPCIEEQLIYKI